MDFCNEMQKHVHEVVGSVRLAELKEDRHNHRFAGMTGEAIKIPGGLMTSEVIHVPGGHIHKFQTTTDFYENHFHPICVKTGLQVMVGKCDDARHIHFIDDKTEVEDNHFHEFIAATLIENPIGD